MTLRTPHTKRSHGHSGSRGAAHLFTLLTTAGGRQRSALVRVWTTRMRDPDGREGARMHRKGRWAAMELYVHDKRLVFARLVAAVP